MKLCILACYLLFDGRHKCVVDEQKVCAEWQYECRPSKSVLCVTWAKNLGKWDPVPVDYIPAKSTSRAWSE